MFSAYRTARNQYRDAWRSAARLQDRVVTTGKKCLRTFLMTTVEKSIRSIVEMFFFEKEEPTLDDVKVDIDDLSLSHNGFKNARMGYIKATEQLKVKHRIFQLLERLYMIMIFKQLVNEHGFTINKVARLYGIWSQSISKWIKEEDKFWVELAELRKELE